MNKDTLKIKHELDRFGYGTINYPQSIRNSVADVMNKFRSFCSQPLEHKQNMSYQNSMGYENRDRSTDSASVDHKESFYIKANYNLPSSFLTSEIDGEFVLSCKRLLDEIVPLVDNSVRILSEIANLNLSQYFDKSALTLRAIHYYPDTSEEIAHHHVDRGGQTYHLYETTDGLESYWQGKWSKIIFNKGQMIYFPGIQAQFASKCALKGLCHRVVSNDESTKRGRYSLVLFIDYYKLSHKYSMRKRGPIEKAFTPGQNYDIAFPLLKDYFEERI